MNKKIISLGTMICFLAFTLSCYVTKKEKVKSIADWKGKDVTILGVVKTSGEYIKFPEKRPASIQKEAVVGPAPGGQAKILKMSDVKVFARDKDNRITEIKLKKGGVFKIGKDSDYQSAELKDDQIIIATLMSVSIPLSEIETIYVKRTDPGKTFLAAIGVTAGALAALVGIAMLTKESCPFIYSFDGSKYIFDAEPYGGATSPGLQRTEWCGLEHLREVNGQYKIMMTNEVDETQNTDELHLVVIDHPQGTVVIPDESGKIHTFAEAQAPIRAFDGKGLNIMPAVAKNDQWFWLTKTDEKNPEKKEDLRDELTFEFPKPRQATKAKLLFNGCNTLWASQMVKRFLELYGSDVTKTYDVLKERGSAYQMLMAWNEREELYRLQIRVETENGWKSKGTIVGGGPFVSEDKAYSLDLSDVQGETLRIKVTPPAEFWMINYLAVDYTQDSPLQATEIEPVLAIDSTGQDIRETLVQNDSRYCVMPNIGDAAFITFQAPAQSSGLARSVILKAGGYYTIHCEAKGACQMDTLRRFLAEPGFAVQYSFKEYLKWKKETLESLKKQ